jgi:hypothetical protein
MPAKSSVGLSSVRARANICVPRPAPSRKNVNGKRAIAQITIKLEIENKTKILNVKQL